jgi:hypothetical protein
MHAVHSCAKRQLLKAVTYALGTQGLPQLQCASPVGHHWGSHQAILCMYCCCQYQTMHGHRELEVTAATLDEVHALLPELFLSISQGCQSRDADNCSHIHANISSSRIKLILVSQTSSCWAAAQTLCQVPGTIPTDHPDVLGAHPALFRAQ